MSIDNENHFFQQYKQQEEKSLELARMIQKAAIEVNAFIAARKDCQELWEAQKLNNKDEMWRIFQKHMREMQQQIYEYQFVFRVTVIPIDQATYDRMTVQDVRNQIDLLVGAICAIRGIKIGLEVFKECLRKVLKQTGKYSNQEIESTLSLIERLFPTDR